MTVTVYISSYRVCDYNDEVQTVSSARDSVLVSLGLYDKHLLKHYIMSGMNKHTLSSIRFFHSYADQQQLLCNYTVSRVVCYVDKMAVTATGQPVTLQCAAHLFFIQRASPNRTPCAGGFCSSSFRPTFNLHILDAVLLCPVRHVF